MLRNPDNFEIFDNIEDECANHLLNQIFEAIEIIFSAVNHEYKNNILIYTLAN